MPVTLTTEIEAVNAILATIGESPINSLGGSLTPDVSLAKKTLDEVSREVQTLGWSFNTDHGFPLTRNGSNEIVLPTNTARCEVGRAAYPSVEVVQRGPKLYDRKNRTYTFTADLKAERLVVFLDWSEMPEAARRYILIRAARIFQDRVQGDQAAHVYTTQDEMNAKRVLTAECSEVDDLNVLNSPGVSYIVWR